MRRIIDKYRPVFEKYREMIVYVFFGGLTTLVNYASYIALADLLHFSTGLSTSAAWAVSVAFAFVTNKIWVFQSKSWEISIASRELLSFVAARALSGALDLGVMVLLVDYAHFNDKIIKLLSNILVIIINYIASKLFIFKDKKREGMENERNNQKPS